MTENNLSAIELKIQKLIAHEQSAREIGSLNEANAFAEKIAGLCEEYGIEISRLAQAGDGLEQRWMFMESAAFEMVGIAKETTNEPK